jgi:FAD/FMN-containing dehydrogenase
VADTIESRTYLGTFGMTGGTPRPFSGVKGSYLESISDDAIETVLDRIAQAPAPGAAIGLDHYMHGAVCRVAPDATALVHRAPGTVHVWITNGWDTGPDGSAAMRWVEETWSALQPYAGGRAYANFPGAEGEAASRAAYGENYERLADLKEKFDPGNLFRGNQNIVPAGD